MRIYPVIKPINIGVLLMLIMVQNMPGAAIAATASYDLTGIGRLNPPTAGALEVADGIEVLPAPTGLRVVRATI